MKVAMNSDKVALMESGWVASSALPNAYLRGMVTRNIYLCCFFSFFAVFETFSGPTPLLSQQYPDDLVFVSVGARLFTK
jgi:predicted membrane chloride channel (bestrophin family)